MYIVSTSCGVEKEPLLTAFGFKGNALTCLWQIAARMESEKNVGVGLGLQSVLWSDANVFKTYGEADSNEMMFSVTKYALSLVAGREFADPGELLDAIFPEVYAYAKKVTKMEGVSKTFVLNALVPVDFAAWQLYLKEEGKAGFDDIATFDGERQEKLANVPLITYGALVSDVVRMAKNNTPLFKIKIGSDPDKDGDYGKMLAWDKNRLLEIHTALKDIRTSHTEDGRILYYLDANGRYDSKERLLDLLDFCRENGFLDRIILLEEPFAEENHVFVGDLPVCVAADESVHDMEALEERYALGYKALTLKPIAKGLTMSARMHAFAKAHGMVSFCADLTVNPVMVSWNQCVAARLCRLAGMKVGVVESNGGQNYVNWEQMKSYHPAYPAAYITDRDGVFELDEAFWSTSAAIKETGAYYDKLSRGEEA